MRSTRVAWLGLMLIATGLLPALWAASEVAGGLIDVSRHWWSTLAIAPIAVGVAMTAIGLARANRED
jgi:hypothetical protein